MNRRPFSKRLKLKSKCHRNSETMGCSIFCDDGNVINFGRIICVNWSNSGNGRPADNRRLIVDRRNVVGVVGVVRSDVDADVRKRGQARSKRWICSVKSRRWEIDQTFKYGQFYFQMFDSMTKYVIYQKEWNSWREVNARQECVERSQVQIPVPAKDFFLMKYL